ncbi:MAG TPA: response regulator [Ktedonobacterales bacterium]|nr:response regulator [Ktedonobacterales bacterium]
MNATALRPILIVDDDEAILSSMELALSDEGYPVVVARNGRDALELARSASPRLILLDMKMPVMDGWAFAEAYRSQESQGGARAPIIAMTAAHDSERQAAEVAVDGYIAKPFDLNELLDLILRYSGN